jgi:UDPglucose--hexose-1-phosphate uridylyltransferase
LFALGGESGRPADSPGWLVRVVPNLYSAFERQQIVIHSPQHVCSLVGLEPTQLELIVEAWAEVAERAWREGFDHLQVFVNEGRIAGASLPHSHSQLVWLKEAPPEIAAEAPRLALGACALCSLLQDLPPELLLLERKVGESTLQLAVSPTGRAPYELLVASSEHLGDAFGATDQLTAAFELAVAGVRMLSAAEGPSPFNIWLHNFQSSEAGGGHWHLEIVPRLNVFAGVELGLGIYVNPVAPSTAASRLREAAQSTKR